MGREGQENQKARRDKEGQEDQGRPGGPGKPRRCREGQEDQGRPGGPGKTRRAREGSLLPLASSGSSVSPGLREFSHPSALRPHSFSAKGGGTVEMYSIALSMTDIALFR
jgi:hypothetical protein